MKLTSFAEVMSALEPYYPNNVQRPAMYTTEYVQQFLATLGDPQEKMKVIHVAGTSGKTSTCYYLAALLNAAGKRVGHTMSPHLDTINERVQIDLVPMPETEFCTELGLFMDAVEQSGITLTFFEIMSAFTFWTFQRHGVEYAVIEVGLGGLLDATNVVESSDKVAVITDIGLDHQQYLGSTIREIAAHKAGIIQLKNQVFCYRQSAEVMKEIEVRARQKQAGLHTFNAPEVSTEFAFLPVFQQRNFYLACEAAGFVAQRDGFRIAKKQQQAAARTLVPGRMEAITYKNRQVILDGAHNAQKLRALTGSLRAMYPGQEVAVLAAFVTSGDRLPPSAAEVAGLADHLIATQPVSAYPFRQFEEPLLVIAHCKTHGQWSSEIQSDLRKALDTLVARPEPVLVVTGSLYLLSAIRQLLKPSRLSGAD